MKRLQRSPPTGLTADVPIELMLDLLKPLGGGVNGQKHPSSDVPGRLLYPPADEANYLDRKIGAF